jgi:hypothetical protein
VLKIFKTDTHSLWPSSLIVSFVIMLLFLAIEDNTVRAQQQSQTAQPTRLGTPIAIAITGNVLTVVSFLIGTSSFIMGLRIQNVTKATSSLSSSITKYFEILILALIIPAIIIILYYIIFLVGIHLYPADSPYLALVYVLLIPAGAILFLLIKLRS